VDDGDHPKRAATPARGVRGVVRAVASLATALAVAAVICSCAIDYNESLSIRRDDKVERPVERGFYTIFILHCPLVLAPAPGEAKCGVHHPYIWNSIVWLFPVDVVCLAE